MTTTPTAPTRRGDHAGRRHDILTAAADLLAERSWDGFTMRDVAARAGLSAGAVYQYFDGKRQIFAALYEERLRAELGAIEALDPGTGLREVVGRVVRDFAEIYTRFGRHHLAWTAGGLGPSAATQRLGETFRRLAQSVEQAIDAAARREGRTLATGRGLLPFLWAACNGVGDQLIDERHRLHECSRQEFLDFAADGLVEALTRPAG